MPDKLTGIFCPVCDRIEHGKTQSRMVDSQLGMNHKGNYHCSGMGHKMSKSQLESLNPRMLKLQVTEKQPGNTSQQTFWIYPEALDALRTKFPNNLMTTICSLFNTLADPDTIVIEGEHMRELRTLGVHRGRDIVGLAKANQSLQEQLKEMTAAQKQYEMVAKLLSMAGGAGGQALLTGQGPSSQDLTQALQQPDQEPKLPPRRQPVPFIEPEAEHTYYEAVEPGNFGDSSLTVPTHNQVVKFGQGPAQ